jgi:hypothetical protein
VTGKILETLLTDLMTPILAKPQSELQAGFTAGRSPLNAAFLLQEEINQAKDTKELLYKAFVDAKTAFDVVSQSSLSRKLFFDGINEDLWLLLTELQEEAETQVKWGRP